MASYYVWSGATGSANGTSWANAYTALATAVSGKAAGDIFYVAHDHVNSTGSIDYYFPGTIISPTKIICVDRTGSVPPVSADRRATAQINTTGNGIMNLNGVVHFDGIIFGLGNTAFAPQFNPQNTNGLWTRFDNCSIRLVSTGTGSIQIGSTSFGVYIEWKNTTVSFSNVGQTIFVAGVLKWRNTLAALIGAQVPTRLFTTVHGIGGEVDCLGVDLSAAGSGKTLVYSNQVGSTADKFMFVDCKLDGAVTKSTVPLSHGSHEIDFVRCGSSGVNYTNYRHRISGLLTEETTVVRTGGASDGTTPLSWKIITTTSANYSMPFECPPIAIWNDTTGSPVTATVEGIAAALPTDQEVWLEVEYLGDASSPKGSFVNDGKADLLATAANQTSSSETWGGSTAAFKLAVTFTPQQKGWIYARVKIGKASSTIYIDPLVTLT